MQPLARMETGLFVLVVFFAAAVRLTGLADESLWVDEGQTALYAALEVVGIVSYCASDVHPPLYLLIVHLFISLFGDGETVLRLPSALADMGSLFLLFLIAGRYAGNRVAILAAALFACAPLALHYAQEARSYALLNFSILLSFWWLLRYTQQLDRTSGTLYMFSVTLMFYLHYYTLFIVAMQQLMIAFAVFHSKERVRHLLQWGAFALGAVVLYLPWMIVLLSQLKDKVKGDGPGNWVPLPELETYWHYVELLTGGKWGVMLFVLTGALFVTFAINRQWKREEKLLFQAVAVWFLGATFMPIVISYGVTPIFFPRLSIIFLPALILLTALMVHAISHRFAGKGLIGLLIVYESMGIYFHHTTIEKEPWRDAVAMIASSISEQDSAIVLSAPWIDKPVMYYLDKTFYPALIAGLNATYVTDMTRDKAQVWLLLGYDRFSDPDSGIAAALAKSLREVKTVDVTDGYAINPLYAGTLEHVRLKVFASRHQGRLRVRDVMLFASQKQKRVLVMAQGGAWNRHSLWIEQLPDGSLQAVAFADEVFCAAARTEPVTLEDEPYTIEARWNRAELQLWMDGRLIAREAWATPFEERFEILSIAAAADGKFQAPGRYGSVSMCMNTGHCQRFEGVENKMVTYPVTNSFSQ